MGPLLETAGATLIVAIAALAGAAASRLRRISWALALAAPFAVILSVALARRFNRLGFVPPFEWLMKGRVEFVALGVAAAALLAMLCMRLPVKRQRIMVAVFACLAVAYLTVLPSALPAITSSRLLLLDTQVDSNGVCLQNTAYTCGPAAAVTCLKALGVEASEGELAVLSRTTPTGGTEPDLLCAAVESRYGKEGISGEYAALDSIEDLPSGAVMLALVKYTFFVDHYVAVLGVSNGQVTVGDPLEGLRTVPVKEFEKSWRFAGVVVRKR